MVEKENEKYIIRRRIYYLQWRGKIFGEEKKEKHLEKGNIFCRGDNKEENI